MGLYQSRFHSRVNQIILHHAHWSSQRTHCPIRSQNLAPGAGIKLQFCHVTRFKKRHVQKQLFFKPRHTLTYGRFFTNFTWESNGTWVSNRPWIPCNPKSLHDLPALWVMLSWENVMIKSDSGYSITFEKSLSPLGRYQTANL